MTLPTELSRPVCRTLALAASIAVSACGGGGGGDVNVSANAAPAPNAGASAADTPTPAASAPTTSALEAEPPAMDAIALSAPESSVIHIEAALNTQDGVNDGTGGAGAETAQIAAVPFASSVGRVFYVDSRNGQDANDGLAASAGNAGSGPWRTLAKVAAAALLPGDVVRLTCGSSWNETLRVNASGTASNPISVVAYPAGCSTPPRVDGATSIAGTAWVRHSGSIYKATLAMPALQLNAATGNFTLAHHPNRGFDSTRPQSLFIRTAADADRATINGRTVSTTIPTGTSLSVPVGTNLAAGARVRVRTNAWTIDESAISGYGNGRLSLAQPTSYPLLSGWGYFLIGQLWMLDSPGEWHYDSALQTLYAWMPDSSVPSTNLAITTLATGIDLESRKYVVVEGLTVSQVGIGANLRNGVSLVLRGNRVERTAGVGLDAAGSTGVEVTGNTFYRTGAEAINGIDRTVKPAVLMQVTGNIVTDSGLTFDAAQVTSLPVHVTGAIVPGDRSLVSANTITNAAYHGIRTTGASTIVQNTVTSACLVLDDCGGIYVYGAVRGTSIDKNTVRDIPGGLDGKPAGTTSQGQGIFLDDHANLVTITANTVSNAETGIFLHNSYASTVSRNVLYGNRKHQLWLFEDSNITANTGDIYGNIVSDNLMFGNTPSAAVGQQSTIGETARFATFDRNRYSALISNRVVTESWPTGSNSFQFADWQAALTSSGVARRPDSSGSVLNPVGFASIRTLGGNIVLNGDIASGSRGWTPWNDLSPLATATATTCAGVPCLDVAAGASASLVASPAFSVVGDKWYRVTFDLRSSKAGQPVALLVRRGGGGSNGYESLMGSAEMVNAPGSFQRFSFAFKSTKTVNAADPVTKDIGARLYFDRIQPGTKITLMNVEVVPITSADATVTTRLMSNDSAAAAVLACPEAATNPARCSQYKDFGTGLPVAWPLSLAGYQSQIVYTRDTSLVDSDGDGISDVQDQCPATPAGATTNARGCSI